MSQWEGVLFLCPRCNSNPVHRYSPICKPCKESNVEHYGRTRTRADVSRADVGSHARKVLAQRKKKCEGCGHERHIEACHVRPVRTFPKTALLSEVNHPDNLKWLCPNCHKAMDENPDGWKKAQEQGVMK